MSKKLRLILLGQIGRLPFGGMAWLTMHYLGGFRRLGHEVYYVEDTWDWPYLAPGQTSVAPACRATAEYLNGAMSLCDMHSCWAYRSIAQKGHLYGLSKSEFRRVFTRADVLINLAGCTVLHDEHLKVPIRVYLQNDPGSGEILAARGDPDTLEMLGAHTHFFNLAENLGKPYCGLPPGPFPYRPTRQPIVLEWFTPPPFLSRNGKRPDKLRFTTVGNWKQTGDDIEWNGELYTWSKHFEFLKFLDLPRRIGRPVELALSSITAKDLRLLRGRGWRVADAHRFSRDLLRYRDYIFRSDAEFTVAKDQNVRLRSGWFSERSACYLAASKPVITQDTGFGRVLPTGEGLFAFNTMEEIVAAFEAVRSDYAKHSRAARAIAEEYFRAEKVLSKMLDAIGI